MSADKDRYFIQNVIGISGVEFLWGLGLPVVVESTFLQLFLKNLGASSFVIGLIPFFFFVGISVFALFSSYFTANLEFKRTAVILLHLVSGISMLLIGINLLIFKQVSLILSAFFFCYAVFSVCVGMTLPVWLNYLVKIFSKEKSVAGLGFMIIAQNIGKLICSLVILKVVARYSFSPVSSALVFIAVGAVFILGSLLFLFTKEINQAGDALPAGKTTFFTYVSRSCRHMLKDRNFLTFLAGDSMIFIVITAISFYANYATTYRGIDPAVAAGVFIGCIYTGAILSNILLGTAGYLSLKQKYLLSNTTALAGLISLTIVTSTWGFYIASLLLGFARGTRMLAYPLSVKRLSELRDSTSYFAIGPIFTLPFATLLPLATGKFLDLFSTLEADSYRIVFLAAVFLALVTFVCLLKTDFDPMTQKEDA